MSDQTRTRKPSSRLWLLAPYALIAVAIAGLATGWVVERQRIVVELQATASTLRAQGYQVQMSEPQVRGFPFRMRLSVEQFHVSAPSGWAIRADGLTGEANIYALGHWVLNAPAGLVITRPVGGDLMVRGQTIRASLAALEAPVWRIAVEGVSLSLAPGPGAAPFSLKSADRLEIYTRQSPSIPNAGEALIRLDGGLATPGTPLGAVTGAHRLNAGIALRMRRFDQYKGGSWPGAWLHWARAGGKIETDPTQPPGPDLRLSSGPGALIFGSDGRPMGSISLRVLDAAGAPAKDLPLSFTGGRSTLGAADIGPAPRIF